METGTRKLLVRLGVSLALAAGFAWWLSHQGLRVVPSRAEFSALTPWALPVYAVCLVVFHLLRAGRWVFLLRAVSDVPLRRVVLVSLVGFLAVLVLPLRTGELARPLLIRRHGGVPTSAALGTVAVERVLDGVLVSLALTACLLALPARPGPYLWLLRLAPLGVFVAALAMLLLFLWRTEQVIGVAARAAGRISPRLAEPAARALRGIAAGVAALPDRRALGRFLGASLAFWVSNAVGIFLLARGCGLDLGLVQSAGVMAVLSVGILLPAGPGFFGAFQAAALVALGFFLPPQVVAARASVFIFVLYAGQVVFTLGFGFLAAVLGGVSLRGITRSRIAQLAADDVAEWS